MYIGIPHICLYSLKVGVVSDQKINILECFIGFSAGLTKNEFDSVLLGSNSPENQPDKCAIKFLMITWIILHHLHIEREFHEVVQQFYESPLTVNNKKIYSQSSERKYVFVKTRKVYNEKWIFNRPASNTNERISWGTFRDGYVDRSREENCELKLKSCKGKVEFNFLFHYKMKRRYYQPAHNNYFLTIICFTRFKTLKYRK